MSAFGSFGHDQRELLPAELPTDTLAWAEEEGLGREKSSCPTRRRMTYGPGQDKSPDAHPEFYSPL